MRQKNSFIQKHIFSFLSSCRIHFKPSIKKSHREFLFARIHKKMPPEATECDISAVMHSSLLKHVHDATREIKGPLAFGY